jgi:hypothetical protein
MRPTPDLTAPTVADVLAGAAGCAGVALLVIAASALTVKLTGLAGDARRLLRFGFGGVEHTPAEAARIAIHNARLAAGTLLCAAARPRIPTRARPAVDALLAALLAFNAGVIGVALGGYGTRLTTATGRHAPLELAAFSLAGGAYIATRGRPLRAFTVAAITALCGLLLAGAATLETYATPGSQR